MDNFLPPRSLLLRTRDNTLFKVTDSLEHPEIASVDTDECDRVYYLGGVEYLGFDGEVYSLLVD